MRASREERRVRGAIQSAHLAVGRYAIGEKMPTARIRHMARVFNIPWTRADLETPAVLTPPVGGSYRLVMSSALPAPVENYILLHETAHVLAGDAEEPMILQFSGPLPEAEEVADMFALAGLVNDIDCEQGSDWLEDRIRELVPLEDRGWQQHRVPRLANKMLRMRRLIAERID